MVKKQNKNKNSSEFGGMLKMAHLSASCEEYFQVCTEGEVGMHGKTPQKLAQCLLPLVQESIAHVVKIASQLLPRKGLQGRREGGREREERGEGGRKGGGKGEGEGGREGGKESGGKGGRVIIRQLRSV